MAKRYLQQLKNGCPPVTYTKILSLAVPGLHFPSGVATTMGDNIKCSVSVQRMISLLEFMVYTALKIHADVYVMPLPEWKLFNANNNELDTMDSLDNFILYHLFFIAFKDLETVTLFYNMLVIELLENAANDDPPPPAVDADEDETTAAVVAKPKFRAGDRNLITTGRGKFRQGMPPQDVATQLRIQSYEDIYFTLQKMGYDVGLLHSIEAGATTFNNQVKDMLNNCLTIAKTLDTLKTPRGLIFPPFLESLKITENIFANAILDNKLLFQVPRSSFILKDPLSQFYLPNIVMPTKNLNYLNADMIGFVDDICVESDTKGSVYRNSHHIMGRTALAYQKMFKKLLQLSRGPSWDDCYRYCRNVKHFIFSQPLVGGSPSVYNDLERSLTRLETRARNSPVMKSILSPEQWVPGEMTVLEHFSRICIAVIYASGQRDNFMTVVLGVITATGCDRFEGGDSDQTQLSGKPGCGKSNIMRTLSLLITKELQTTCDASSPRAMTMGYNSFKVGSVTASESENFMRINFIDDSKGNYVASSGSRKDVDGDSMKLAAGSKGCVNYKKIDKVTDANGNTSMCLINTITATKHTGFSGSNGQESTAAGQSRTNTLYLQKSKLNAAQQAGAVCNLDINSDTQSMLDQAAAIEYRVAQIQALHGDVTYGMLSEPTQALFTTTIIRIGETKNAARLFGDDYKTMTDPRVISRVARTCINVLRMYQMHLLDTCGFDNVFLRDDPLKRLKVLEESACINPAVLTFALSASLGICNGVSNMSTEVCMCLKELIELDSTGLVPQIEMKNNASYYRLTMGAAGVDDAVTRQMTTSYEASDIRASLQKVYTGRIPGFSDRKNMEKCGKDKFEKLLISCELLDNILCPIERSLLVAFKALYTFQRERYRPTERDVFAHDERNRYLLITDEMEHLFMPGDDASLDRFKILFREMGKNYYVAMDFLQKNTSIDGCDGTVLMKNCNHKVHPLDLQNTRDIALKYYFPPANLPSGLMKAKLAISLKALNEMDTQGSNGFNILQSVPFFRQETLIIARGLFDKPDEPMSMKCEKMQEAFTIGNPHYAPKHSRFLGLFDRTFAADNEFFGTKYERIEIPPGEIFALYEVYCRVFTLHGRAPLKESRPDFQQHFLKHGVSLTTPYVPFFPKPYAVENTNENVGTIFDMFQDLAFEMSAAGVTDEIVSHLVSYPVSRKRRAAAATESATRRRFL